MHLLTMQCCLGSTMQPKLSQGTICSPILWGQVATRFQPWWITCFDFAYAVLEQLAQVAGPCVFDRQASVLRNDVFLLQTADAEPTTVSATEAFSFYAAVEKIPDLRSLKYNQTIAELSRLASQQRKGQMIYHGSGGQYWSYAPRK